MYWIADVLFGDGGKGALTDWLVSETQATLDVRYTGGSQSARCVLVDLVQEHKFSQWGAGTFNPNVVTVLGPQVRFDPITAIKEELQLRSKRVVDPFERLLIDRNVLIITPFHVAQSQDNITLHQRGSTGMGVGVSYRHSLEHPEEAIRFSDFKNLDEVYFRLQRQQARFKQAAIHRQVPSLNEIMRFFEHVAQKTIHNEMYPASFKLLLNETNVTIAEGAHGFYLDSELGFKPYVTSSRTTFVNAEDIFVNTGIQPIRIGVCGIYTTRHGPGDLPTECAELAYLPKDTNQTVSEGQGEVRRGWLDCHLLHYSAHYLKLDGLCINRLDHWKYLNKWRLALAGRDGAGAPIYWETDNLDRFLERIEKEVGVPIVITGRGNGRAAYSWRTNKHE